MVALVLIFRLWEWLKQKSSWEIFLTDLINDEALNDVVKNDNVPICHMKHR